MRYRAFVSSTYRDLKDHRAWVIDRLERSGIDVDPMEKWTAANDEPKELSQERVRECDFCILLVGFRRGYVPEGQNRSVTQLEIDEAQRRGIDVLPFMANEEADWPAESIAALKDDPEMARWRADLKNDKTISFFGPRPESVDVDTAVNRWLQKTIAIPTETTIGAVSSDVGPIEIRAYGNSEGVLVVWRSDQLIKGCRGFSLHRRVLNDVGSAEEIVHTYLGFRGLKVSPPGVAVPSHQQPIQNFRWTDREHREVRYRVVPVVGNPPKLQEMDAQHAGSAWTGWIRPRTSQSRGYSLFFNQVQAHLTDLPAWQKLGRIVATSEDAMVREIRRLPELSAYLGGELRQTLLDRLNGARLTDLRLCGVLSELDDPELIGAIENVGRNFRLILGCPLNHRMPNKESSRVRRARLFQELRAAQVQVYESEKFRTRCNFIVLCDRWGSPVSVWTESASWTTRSLCLYTNNGILVDSVPLARAYLDRWESFLDACNANVPKSIPGKFVTPHFRDQGTSITLWNTPTRRTADLRDVSRLIRGARQGVLFVVNAKRVMDSLMRDILGLVRDKDLFVEGLSWRNRGRRVEYRYYLNEQSQVLIKSGGRIGSNVILVDPFGPHPVVMTGSHDFSLESSARILSDLLIIENLSGLAAEYAAHLIGLFDNYRFRFAITRRGRAFFGLDPTDRWQQRYLTGDKRSEFNFLFGSLSPRL